MRQLDEKTLVSGQVDPQDMASIKADGVTMIVNNRPDGEEPGQPLGTAIKAAAEQAGIAYRYLPIARGIGPSDAEAMQEAMHATGGKVLAFCKTGMRSALLWAVAQASEGREREEIEQAAQQAGFDLAPVAHLL